MRTRLGLAFVTLLFAACGNSVDAACSRAKECTAKAGTAFSETQCKTTFQSSRESAVSVKCGSQYDEYIYCLVGLPCTFSDADVDAECGAKVKALENCQGK